MIVNFSLNRIETYPLSEMCVARIPIQNHIDVYTNVCVKFKEDYFGLTDDFIKSNNSILNY